MKTMNELKRAVFIGWQEDIDGYPPIALFNVFTSDRKYPHGTTVDVNTLLEWNIKVPVFPNFESWKKQERS